MKINAQEELALQLLFCDDDDFSKSMRFRIAGAIVEKRESTGIGFYSSIKLIPALNDIPQLKIYSFVFECPSLPYGGSFDCYILGPELILLEAVTFCGAEWPNTLDVAGIRRV